jgi:hypothetical protein
LSHASSHYHQSKKLNIINVSDIPFIVHPKWVLLFPPKALSLLVILLHFFTFIIYMYIPKHWIHFFLLKSYLMYSFQMEFLLKIVFKI